LFAIPPQRYEENSVRLNEMPKNELKEIGIMRIMGLRRRQYYSHYSNFFQIKPT
jgi:hypothetical protein